jgi:hypothetical protein
MTLIEIFTILIIHWIADFLCQTDKMAQGKSKNWGDLLRHTFTYSMIFGFFMCFILPVESNIFLPTLFFLITFVAHTITDYFTSRLNSKLWAEGKVHWFFVSIGFDQILHYIQLFSTYQILTKWV